MVDYRYKWIGTEMQGEQLLRAQSQGWSMVPPGEEPKHLSPASSTERWKTFSFLDPANGVAQGSMRLHRMLETDAAARDKHYVDKAAADLVAAKAVFDLSDSPENDLIAKLEDFYNPMWLATHDHAWEHGNVAANLIRAKLGLPLWTRESVRRAVLEHLKTNKKTKRRQRGDGWYKENGICWPVYGNAKELRLKWRMPQNALEWLEMLLGDVRKLLSSR